MLYYLLLLVSFDKSGCTAFGAVSGAGDELYLSCVAGSKWPNSTHTIRPLVVEDRLWALIDLAISPEDQKAGKSTGKPAIVGNRNNCAFVTIKCAL
jgi:hypothetical protein